MENETITKILPESKLFVVVTGIIFTLIGLFIVQLVKQEPKLLVVIVTILTGWFIGQLVEQVVKKALIKLKLDETIKKKNLEKAIFGLSMTNLISSFMKWYIVLVFLKEAIVRIELTSLAQFFDAVLMAIPDWILGGMILIGAMILGNFFSDKIKEREFIFSEVVGGIVYFFIMYIAVVLTLPKFGFVNTALLEDVFRYLILGISIGLALALGISFGFALREPASEFIKKWQKKK